MIRPDLEAWVTRSLGSRPLERLFAVSHLSAVVGVRLADGREIVVKARSGLDRATTCVAAQSALHADGFPCPKPLTVVQELGGLAVHAEEYVSGGHQLVGPGWEVADAFAGLLADVISRSRRLGLGRPEPPPMWLAWDHDGPDVWPALQEQPPNPEAIASGSWLTDMITRLSLRLRETSLDEIVGHGDWEAQNMVWRNGRQVHVVHDWDSLTARPEAALAGAAAATFASRDQPCLAPLESSERFLETYQLRAGRRFADEEIEIAWAAGLWLAAHNARMELLYDKPPLILTTLQEESA